MRRQRRLLALTVVVLVHLTIAFAHGAAHLAAGGYQSPSALAFVFLVIVAGPLVGLVWMRRSIAAGAWLIAATMTGALLFGLLNHFVIRGADRVDAVVGPVRTWFEATAVLLVITEAAGAMLAATYGRRAARRLA
jgi:hypothetical protein